METDDPLTDDEMGLVELFGYDKLERELILRQNNFSLIPPQYSALNDFRDEMTPEEAYSYSEQVLKSDGFDVSGIPGVSCCHQIQPCNIDYNYDMYKRYSQLAIDEYNRRFKDANAELEFVKVLKVMGQASRGIRYYLTFMAKDLGDGGEIKTYQAVVLDGLDSKTANSFRLKPPEDDRDSGSHGRQWFWENHLCNG
ncbi:hypothetical protein I3843_10G101100 [Carya illinoinensis]|uniref:Cystatin domain-containing protein n=2 Tax=Carya illinoinensis TaxID=32201 RepID=A0A922J2N1_CARIL|nr:uncharacterized protein LOC122279428 isoform X2 [Carya illinoinensis]KAG2685004.1 hypothetical protein I3760_10G104000 [Carya illinoinensis]KAG6692256.1 hypothetical protein I3842_10G105800 [Carya illinoinensis]KAG7960034.1 hypothetical protein I3843_10G101100 [Carya illinoinensis]